MIHDGGEQGLAIEISTKKIIPFRGVPGVWWVEDLFRGLFHVIWRERGSSSGRFARSWREDKRRYVVSSRLVSSPGMSVFCDRFYFPAFITLFFNLYTRHATFVRCIEMERILSF